MSGSVLVEKNTPKATGNQTAMQISVTANGTVTVFELNNSPAAQRPV